MLQWPESDGAGSDVDSFDASPLIRNRMYEAMDDDENTWLVGMNRRQSRSPCVICFNCILSMFAKCCAMWRTCRRGPERRERTVPLVPTAQRRDELKRAFTQNRVRNQKYSLITFIPLVLIEQFKFFLNLYFLIMALSQFIPAIRIGYLITYWGPLIFVITVTMIREAFDDFYRFRRDREMNSKVYERLVPNGTIKVPSSKIQVGDMIVLHKDERIPADMILLRTTEKQGACFIRTDQLDGETDWKLRVAVAPTQQLHCDQDIFDLAGEIYAEKPQRDIHNFVGTMRLWRNAEQQQQQSPVDGAAGSDTADVSVNIESALWADTVLASGTAVGFVVYTGRETRSVMNASQPSSKVGLLDMEVNNLTKVLFVFTVGLSFAMVCLKGFDGPWYRYFVRFILLFSYIIPISLRVNMDMAKVAYSWLIGRDKDMHGVVVRSSTIPEELGRIQYLLSDKTGTLTKNEMVFKKLHLGTVSFGADTFDEIGSHMRNAYASGAVATDAPTSPQQGHAQSRHSLLSRLAKAVEAIALCHNVTPLYDDGGSGGGACSPTADGNELASSSDDVGDAAETESVQQMKQTISYQAASPDEVALVEWAESVGMALVQRDLNSITLRLPTGDARQFVILQVFPFTSETKRMGIILKDSQTGRITFYMKGADTVMRTLVQYNDWLDEECANMAREGLRTLVVASKQLTDAQYADFEKQYHAAKVSVVDRGGAVAAVLARLEQDLTLLCLTGVEDALQDEVRPSLELLKNAGIKIWMLTGDKQETAICIAKSSGLFSRTENIHEFGTVLNRVDAHTALNALRRRQTDVALVISGAALKVCLQHYERETAELCCDCTTVVCCRCSPEQKAQLAHLLRKYRSPARVAAIGDGGNDVAMIQAAHAGIGIEAKEGKQASLAADFSINQFAHVCRLMLVHGRYCYKRSCNLGQYVIHRGLIISIMQAIFSCIFYFASVSLYQGMLMVAYSTIYTMFPVFSLVMDKDVKDVVALTYPELYKELAKGRSLSYKTFFIWLLISIYQGAVIMYGALLLFDQDFIHVVSITFTSLIFTELIVIALTIHTWHWTMVVSEAFSVGIYVLSLMFLHYFFDTQYVMTVNFMWKTLAITAVSSVPLYVVKILRRRWAPPAYAKVN